MNIKELIEFEDYIIKNYGEGKIRGPTHLSGGNELQLIQIFKKIGKNDWVFSTHRNHYHALLKSNNPMWVKEEIMNGNSMHISSKKYKFFTSTIVGGNIPIALGTAMAIKRSKRENHVWCFVGDMASQMGVFWECVKYAIGFDLPITFIIEDNNLSVNTPTSEVWNDCMTNFKNNRCSHVIQYSYIRKYPHHGIGKWINFKDEKELHNGKTF
jgi:acetoin:2,6-dichlorophenolindophenol oxidoreductase subunit alpha